MASEGGGKSAASLSKAQKAQKAIERLSKVDSVMEPKVFDDIKVRKSASTPRILNRARGLRVAPKADAGSLTRLSGGGRGVQVCLQAGHEPAKVLELLSDNYHGYAQMVNLLCEWHSFLGDDEKARLFPCCYVPCPGGPHLVVS